MKKILIVDLITLMSVTVDKNFYGYNTMSTGLEIKKCIGRYLLFGRNFQKILDRAQGL